MNATRENSLLSLRGTSPADAMPPPRRRWLARIALPATILLGLALLVAYAARDRLWPAVAVPVVRVVARNAPADAEHTAPDAPPKVIVQAAGWVEPDPFPIYVSALADGIVEEVLVLEGETVAAGQPVARLVADDARLELARAQAEAARLEARLAAAQSHWDQPVALERQVAVSKARLEEEKAAYTELEARIMVQEAVVADARNVHRRLSQAGPETIPKLQIEQAALALESQQRRLEAIRRQRPVTATRVQRYQAELTAAERELDLRIEQRRAVVETRAALDHAQARVAEAQLRLDRMTVVSPAPGVVMERLASPGAKVVRGGDSPYSAQLVHLYDPGSLQVRVDVPLGDAAKVGLDQPAIVVVDVLPDTAFRGRVTRFVHQADVAKNTVQVKVAIEKPSPLLKPEMLARVKFLSTPAADGPNRSAVAGLRLLAPVTAIVSEQDDTVAWVVHPDTSRLVRRIVEASPAADDGWLVVHRGLNPGDVLVSAPTPQLREGLKVRASTTSAARPTGG